MTENAHEILNSLQKEMTDLQYKGVGLSPTEQRLANAIACICAVLKIEDDPNQQQAREKL